MDDTTQTDGASAREPRQPAGGDAATAGRVLTAITCAVLLIGLLVIRGTGASSAVDDQAPDITAENADGDGPSVGDEPRAPQPIVLQPSPPEPPPRSASWSPQEGGESIEGRREPNGEPDKRPGDVASRASGPSRTTAR